MRDCGVQASGEFVAVDPPRRLVFTWGWSHDHAVTTGSTRVEMTLAQEPGEPASCCDTMGSPARINASITVTAGSYT